MVLTPLHFILSSQHYLNPILKLSKRLFIIILRSITAVFQPQLSTVSALFCTLNQHFLNNIWCLLGRDIMGVNKFALKSMSLSWYLQHLNSEISKCPDIWLISSSHSKNMLGLVKIAIPVIFFPVIKLYEKFCAYYLGV